MNKEQSPFLPSTISPEGPKFVLSKESAATFFLLSKKKRWKHVNDCNAVFQRLKKKGCNDSNK